MHKVSKCKDYLALFRLLRFYCVFLGPFVVASISRLLVVVRYNFAVIWPMASQAEGRGWNPGTHLCVFRNSCTKLILKFITNFTVKENSARKPASMRSNSIVLLEFPIRTGPRRNNAPSPVILRRVLCPSVVNI